MLTVKQICEHIWELEKKHNLLHHPIQGVKVWQLLRMVIYYEIAKETGIFTTPHANRETILDILKAAKSVLYVFTKNPLRGNHQKDTLVFDHARKIRVNGEHVDIYSKYLLDTMAPSEYDVIESIYLGKHLSKDAPNRSYLDVVSIGSFLYQKLTPLTFTQVEQQYIKTVETDLNQAFGTTLNLGKLFKTEIKHFKFSVSFYTKLLKKRRPKRIFLVVSYSYYKRPLIAAAKRLGIETIEIQHGTISPFHLGYNFPNTEGELEYFPSTFYSFGEYWNTAASFPLKSENICPYGFPYFTDQKKQFNHLTHTPKTILFISQGVIGKRLSDIALHIGEKLPDYRISYKLHPGEYNRWKEDYPALLKASQLDNVDVVDHNDKNLYEYFATNEYQIGVFSTAMYEGLAFGCKTYVVDLPGVEYMRDLINKGIVTKIETAEQFVAQKDKPTNAAFDSNYFFKKPS